MNYSMIEVLFKVFYCRLCISFYSYLDIVTQVHGNTRFGEEIRLSGNVPALGCDIADRAIPMVTSPSNYPWWTTKQGSYLYF